MPDKETRVITSGDDLSPIRGKPLTLEPPEGLDHGNIRDHVSRL